MKVDPVRLLAICLSFAFACVPLCAQDPVLSAAAGDRYVISAKAGGVNFVEGGVAVKRKAGKSGILLKGDTLDIGDRVSTSVDGKVEILLNPGSFLRLGGNSTFEFVTTSLDDLQVKVEAGSAILEVFAAEEFKVAVSTPSSSYLLIDTGVYRLDVLNERESKLEVWKGKARVGAFSSVAKGRAASIDRTGDVSMEKFDRDEKDALNAWSKARSKELAKAGAKMKRDDVRVALMRSFLGQRWNVFGSFGLWVFDPFYGGYCFLPFGYGWGSPYGYSYGYSMWWYDMPSVVYYPPYHPPGGGGSGGGSTPPAATPIVSAGDRSVVPPFIRMEQTMGGGGIRGGAPGRGNSSYDSSSSSPSYTPSSSSSSPSFPSSSPPSSGSTDSKPVTPGAKP